MQYREYPGDGQGGWLAAVRAVRYTYYKTGHVCNITLKDECTGQGDPDDYDWYYDLAMYNATNGSLWRVLWDKWKEDAQGNVIPETYTKLSAREFYYDGPRQRYLSRDIDPQNWLPIGTWLWTDYSGQLPYDDFTTTGGSAVSEETRYLAGFGVHAQQTVSTGETKYIHADLIDSTMLTTDEGGTAVSAVSYTAFGELITDNCELTTRYQYAGGWGYESDLLMLEGAEGTAPITLQHVGWRWYQPDTGRFIQRDPIGLAGGLNTYAYVLNNPLCGVDPNGLLSLAPLSVGGWTFDPFGGFPIDPFDPELWWRLKWRIAAIVRRATRPATALPVATASVTCVLPVVSGLNVLGDGLPSILHYVRARNAAIRGDWDDYERYRVF